MSAVLHTDAEGRPITEDEAIALQERTFAREFHKALRDPDLLPKWESVLDRDGASVSLLPHFVGPLECARYFGEILVSTPWRDDTIRAYGRAHRVPRRVQYFADEGVPAYTYSSITMAPQPWSEYLTRLRRYVQLATGERFNAALVNLYVDGAHSVGWHADDEPGVGPTIASVSLGAARDFRLRRNADTSDQVKISLSDGSLLVMAGQTQATWQHSLPKRKNVSTPRINVTFRQMS